MRTEMRFESRLFLALLILLAWLPMPFGSNRPWALAIFEIWVALLALFWLNGVRRGWVEIGPAFAGARVVLALLLLWLAWISLQLLPLPEIAGQWLSPMSRDVRALAHQTGWATLTLDHYATLQFWLESMAYVALFALILSLTNSRHRLIMLGYTLVFSAVFQAFYGAVMTLSGLEYGFFIKKVFYLGNSTGTFVNRNHLAGYLEMGLSAGIGLLLATTSRKDHAQTWRQRLRNFLHLVFSPKVPLRLMLAIMVIALVLTRSRMGNTAFFSSMLIAGAIMLLVFRLQTGSVAEMFRRGNTRSAVILITSLVVIDIFIVGAWFGVEKVAQRIAQSSVTHDADRIEVTEGAIKLIWDYPLTGTGGGSFYAAYPRYRDERIVAFYDHAHEDYLEIAAETGLVGLGLLGMVVLLSLLTALKAMYRRRDGLMRGMAFASLMGTIALLIHGTVDFNLQIPANAATFMVMLAFGWIALHLDRDGAAILKRKSPAIED